MIEQIDDEEARRERHRQRIAEMKRVKQKQMRRRQHLKKLLPVAAAILILIVFVFGGIKAVRALSGGKNKESVENGGLTEADLLTAQTKESGQADASGTEPAASGENAGGGDSAEAGNESAGSGAGADGQAGSQTKNYQAKADADTVQIGEYLNSQQQFFSQYAVLIDTSDERIMAQKNATTRINPASMTKVLTVLVAAEHIDEKDLDDKFTMTLEITDYGYINDCSSAGFVDEEVINVRELFYGTILPSGADAAVGLATYVAGSQEAFVDLMNEKIEELGLSRTTHFTNCVGIYDENHYTTAYDMAIIMEAAMDNELCREVMSAHTYQTPETEQHPEGINLSNLFLRRIEDKEGGESVLCAKTGYVVQSGHCAVSYAEDRDGKGYVCVTANASSKWRPIEDHAGLYQEYVF